MSSTVSPQSRRAAEIAFALARATGARVELLFVSQQDGRSRDAMRLTDSLEKHEKREHEEEPTQPDDEHAGSIEGKTRQCREDGTQSLQPRVGGADWLKLVG